MIHNNKKKRLLLPFHPCFSGTWKKKNFYLPSAVFQVETDLTPVENDKTSNVKACNCMKNIHMVMSAFCRQSVFVHFCAKRYAHA